MVNGAVATFGRRFIRKCVAPILIFSVPKGCSAVSRRWRMARGFWSRRFCTARIRGYTGTPAEIAQIAREYRVYYKKVPTADGGYTMDHSAVIYLMGLDGKFVTVIPYQEDDASAIAKLKNLAALTPTS
jgi:SCO1/SenC